MLPRIRPVAQGEFDIQKEHRDDSLRNCTRRLPNGGPDGVRPGQASTTQAKSGRQQPAVIVGFPFCQRRFDAEGGGCLLRSDYGEPTRW